MLFIKQVKVVVSDIKFKDRSIPNPYVAWLTLDVDISCSPDTLGHLVYKHLAQKYGEVRSCTFAYQSEALPPDFKMQGELDPTWHALLNAN